MAKTFPYTVETEPARPAADGRTSASPVYVNHVSASGHPNLEGVSTLWESFDKSVGAFPDNDCLGYRPTGEDGKPGAYTFYSYKQAGDMTAQLSAFLANSAKMSAHGRVGVFGANSPEWMVCMQACNRMTLYVVPLYDTLGEDAIEYIVNHAEVTTVATSAAKFCALAEALPKTKNVSNVIVWGDCNDKVKEAIAGVEKQGITVTPFTDALEAGAAKPVDPVPPKPDDPCTIMYTSGTTGQPKGVLLKHKAALCVVASSTAWLEDSGVGIGPDDCMLSYLPLAHIFDRVTEEFFLASGAKICYWRGDVKGLVGPEGDIVAAAPTLFIGVPRIFDRIYAGFNAKIGAVPGVAGVIKRFLFHWGFARKLSFMQGGRSQASAAPVFDKLVFSKVKEALGGKVKLIASGGAPLASHIEEFLKVTMCCPVVQGYGLTETCAATFIAYPDHFSQTGTVGPPQPCTQFRLESVPEMNYDACPSDGKRPRGEVLITGDLLFSGYYKQQDKTDEVVDKEGWFHTGDIGELTEDGCLKIIDRMKNIFKLSQGEYIAVEKVEGVFKANNLVEQIWVYGNSFESCLVAVVVGSPALKAKADEMGVELTDPKVADLLVKELGSTGKENGLKGFELARAVHVDTTEFSVDNDLLTPTFKLKRPQLQKKYQAEIDAMYAAMK